MVNRQGKRRSMAPSRQRYEASHPTVSFRVNEELYGQLKKLKLQSNLSVADVIKIGLEKTEPLTGEAYDRGFLAGLAESYAVACEGCQDDIMSITDKDN